jgi:hypothetical protein
MSKPKIFIASSAKNIAVANAFKKQLSEYADVSTWKDKFSLYNNESYLETLIQLKDEFEYAIFVWAADDELMNNEESIYAPRDNVVFESGLFMGAMGPSKIFIVYDDTIPIKKPSDFLGINLIRFRGKELKKNKINAVREACSIIKYEIKKQRALFPYLQGDWKSVYEVTYEKELLKVDEVVKIIPFKNGILIKSIKNLAEDSYSAYGKITGDTIYGQWQSFENISDKTGEFILIITPDKESMYGYFTCPDQRSGNLFATWILVKKNEKDKMKSVNPKHFKELQDLLLDSTIKIDFPKTINKNKR